MVDSAKIFDLINNWFKTTGDVIVHADGSVIITGGVHGARTIHGALPVRFSKVHGEFKLGVQLHLETLEGCPEWIRGDFVALGTQLRSLQGGPTHVGGDFRVSLTQSLNLENLDGFPNFVGGSAWLRYSETLPLLRTLVVQGQIHFTWSPGYEYLAKQAVAVGEILMDPRWHAKGRRGMFACKKALIEAGFSGNARW